MNTVKTSKHLKKYICVQILRISCVAAAVPQEDVRLLYEQPGTPQGLSW